MASMEERNKTLVLEAFNALFNKRDYEAPLQFVSAAGMSPFGTFRTCPNFRIESAFGCKAEVGSRNSEGPLLGAKRTSDILHADVDSPAGAWAEQAFLGMI